MIARLSRPAAIVLALIVAAACALCLAVSPPPLQVVQVGGFRSDVQLYRAIADAVAGGEPYYHAAARLQRADHYPLRPFVTVRPPTLAWVAASIGWNGVSAVARVLVLAGVAGWIVGTRGRFRVIERFAMALAVAAGGWPLTLPAVQPLHECLAGLCMTLALAGVVGWPRKWWWIMAPLAVGLAVRETVLPCVLLVAAFALAERRWREAGAWGVLVAVWLGFMAWHAHRVAPLWQPGDEVSQGWAAMQGPVGWLRAIAQTSVLGLLPPSLALLAALLPVVGWLALDGRAGRFCLLLVAGYALILSAFARPDTFYWGALMLPWYFVGYALIPRALGQWLATVNRSHGIVR
jgi:hypothetical protein